MIDTKALREAARYVKKHEKTKKTYDTCVCNGCVSLNLVINPTTLLALLDRIDRLEAVAGAAKEVVTVAKPVIFKNRAGVETYHVDGKLIDSLAAAIGRISVTFTMGMGGDAK
jgi:hypothetical protein